MEKLGVTATEKVGLDLKLFQKGLNFTPVYTLNIKSDLLKTIQICFSIFCLIKSSKIGFIFSPAFYLIMWLMTLQKNFEKISILKI